MLLLPPTASASCGRNDCAGTHTISAVTVQHVDQDGETTLIPVEPDTGETIEVTAYWDVLDEVFPSVCDCRQTATASVTVDVDWSDATDSWSASCTGCNASSGPIYGVTVCHVDGCGTIENAWSYELIVDLATNNGQCDEGAPLGFLSRVEYETTSIDDGDAIREGNCTEWYSVSPTSQTFSVTDSGAFECTYTCAAANGPTLTLIFD